MQKNKRIFLVDDDVVNLKIGKRILQKHYTVVPVTSGGQLFELLQTFRADLILLDIGMLEQDGYEVLKRLKSDPATTNVPVVILAGQDDDSDKTQGFKLGAAEYITKPLVESLLSRRIENLLLLEQQKKELHDFTENFRTLAAERKETTEAMQQAILLWTADLIEVRVGTGSEDIAKMQVCLRAILTEMLNVKSYADEMESWEIGIDTIVHSATLHDIGKIRVPDNILQKLKTLNQSEYEQVKEHATYGRTLIETLKNRLHNEKFLEHAQIMAFMHHERWDGTGYPLGLVGEDIPLLARVMAIVDVYTALTSKRAYKDAISHDDAMKIIKDGQGTQFDPQLVRLLLSISDKLREVNPEQPVHP